MNKKNYTLLELNTHLKRVIALNFQEPVWVTAEIAQIDQSRGHYYLQLIQKNEHSEEITAQIQAVIWNRQWLKIQSSNGQVIKKIVSNGHQVLLLVKLDFNERYGIKLVIQDIDPTYTLGQLQLQKQQVLEQLIKEGLLQQNKSLRIPPVLQKIAILSSQTAAGYQDFINQLQYNSFGFQFQTELFQTAVQGQLASIEMVRQLESVSKKHFDCIVLIRGGGAKIDLSAFDKIDLARKIAHSPIPILTGIGHEIDETIADKVAFSALKTPTAVAAYIINHNRSYETGLEAIAQQIYRIAQNNLIQEHLLLEKIEQQVQFLFQYKLTQTKKSLEFLETEFPVAIKRQLNNASYTIDNFEKIVDGLNPQKIMDRGFTITTCENKVIQSPDEIQKGDKIMTLFKTGKAISIVQ